MNKLIMLSMCVVFTGCAGMNDDFSCTKTASDACMEMKAANNLAKSGGNIDSYQEQKKNLKLAEVAAPASNTYKKSPSQISTTLNQSALEQLDPLQAKAPIRTKEEKSQVWIAPYKDIDDTYHHAQLIEFVTKDSEWEH